MSATASKSQPLVDSQDSATLQGTDIKPQLTALTDVTHNPQDKMSGGTNHTTDEVSNDDDQREHDLFYNDDTIEESISPINGSRSMSAEELDHYITDIAETVKIGLDHSISILTPWFFKNMPTIYYQTTPRVEKIRHLSAIITGHVFETKQTVDLWNKDKSKVTFIGPGGQSEILTAMGRKIAHLDLKMGSIYFSKDKLLFLASFHTTKPAPLDLSNRHISLKLSLIKKSLIEAYPSHQTSVARFLESLDNDFITCSTEIRTNLTYRMVRHMESHEGAHTFFEPREDTPKRGRLTLGMKDASISEIYETVLALIQRKFLVLRNFNICLSHGYESPITVMHFEIQHKKSKIIAKKSPELTGLSKALRTLGWVDRDNYTQFMQPPFHISINAANLLRAMAIWTHVQLSKENAYYYSEYKIHHTLITHEAITRDLLELFRRRFDHSMINEADRNNENAVNKYKELKHELSQKISEQIIDVVSQSIFKSCVAFLDNTLKTNYFMPTKTGISFRLDPKILNPEHYPIKPFGIFFVVGRDYRFFQVRWKDISRGGMRIIPPQSSSGYAHALSGLFDEVFDLSYAQQMKNKDIPEGGSKAVLLVKPGGNHSRCVKGAVNALLDLLVENDESLEEKSSELLKYYTQNEIIYLGPDENMTNQLITWISRQADRRGYLYARAFMSSKPGDGINHKEFGVTSEGLNVFLEHTLMHLGINPKVQSFSIKMTGGPSGDVAGNELKILHREYGENARVCVIADGSGVAYDPHGLDWQELTRLLTASLPIAYFNPDKISTEGDGFVCDSSTLENIKKRDSIYLRTYADVFVPAGGRPYTVTEKNWHHLMADDGSLSCKAIVEGANIFFNTKAREHLEKAGILMIKDSSANKAGVICSSYETLSSLMLSADEFSSIKEKYVDEVMHRLRDMAACEAKLLFQEYDKQGTSTHLSQISLQISDAINDIKDRLLDEFSQHSTKYLNDPMFIGILKKYLPTVLAEKYLDRLSKLPDSYKIAIVASYIASRIVYLEGIDWLRRLPEQYQVTACLTYLKKEENKQQLIKSVMASDLDQKEQIKAILTNYAARELTISELQEHHLNNHQYKG